MFENLHKNSLISIEKAPVTQPNIYILGKYLDNNVCIEWKISSTTQPELAVQKKKTKKK